MEGKGKTYNIYCDESSHLPNDQMPYMIISYVGSPFHQLKTHKEKLRGLKEKHKLKGEIKWSNVSNGQKQFYLDVIDYFFNSDLHFRAVVVDKKQIDNERPDFTYDDFYFRMYYQLIFHKLIRENTYNIYFDEKDTRGQKKLHKLYNILNHSGNVRNFQYIKSYESSLMQVADLVMGAVNYNLRGADKVHAKIEIIDRIKKYSSLSLTRSTYKSEKKFNLFFIDLK